MIASYKFDTDITASLVEELERNGIRVEQNGDGYTLSRGKGSEWHCIKRVIGFPYLAQRRRGAVYRK